MKIRLATKKDVPEIVEMIANDKLGQLREDYQNPLPKQYFNAFDQISSDPNQVLIVFVTESGQVIGTLQWIHWTKLTPSKAIIFAIVYYCRSV